MFIIRVYALFFQHLDVSLLIWSHLYYYCAWWARVQHCVVHCMRSIVNVAIVVIVLCSQLVENREYFWEHNHARFIVRIWIVLASAVSAGGRGAHVHQTVPQRSFIYSARDSPHCAQSDEYVFVYNMLYACVHMIRISCLYPYACPSVCHIETYCTRKLCRIVVEGNGSWILRKASARRDPPCDLIFVWVVRTRSCQNSSLLMSGSARSCSFRYHALSARYKPPTALFY